VSTQARRLRAIATWGAAALPAGCGAPSVPIAAPAPAASAAPSSSAASDALPAPPDESFRLQAPLPTARGHFVPPAAEVQSLQNGIPVVFVAEPSLLETLSVVACGAVSPGAGTDVRELMLVSMLRGTTKYTATALEDRYASILMPQPTWTWSKDGVVFSETFRAADLDAAAVTLAEIVQRPSFDNALFERAREQTARNHDDEKLGPLAEHLIGRIVYGGSAYGDFVSAKGLRAVRRDDVVALHDALFEPGRMTVVASGGLPQDKVLATLERAFGGLRPAKTPGKDPAAPALAAPGPRLVVLDRPATSMAVIVGGYPFPAAGATDDVPARMALQVMMNAATGRGLHRLRDDRKLVLGVHAAGWTAHSGGLNYWVASASFAEVPKVLTEIDSMMRALGTDGPTPDELETVREAFAADFVQDVKTTAEAARSYAGRIMKGLPPEQVTAEITQVDAVTGDAIRAAAAKYLDPSRGRILVAGDLRQLRDPLLSLGWGPVEVRDATGAVVRVERGGEGR
jgi:zinc protease